MKITLLILFNIFAFNSQSQILNHVILISIDGLSGGIFKDTVYQIPNLKSIHKNGGYACNLSSVFPSYTYPSHAAMLTGTLPARSKICYNNKPNSNEWYWFTKDIQVPTLWQALKRNGLTSAAIQWPVSVDTNINWNIPEIWDVDHPEDRITVSRKYATEGLVEEVEANATGKLDSTNMNELYLSLDSNSAKAAAYIFKKYKPNLLAVHFACVDGAQHEHGLSHEKVKLALENADRSIGYILKAIEESGVKDSTTILIVGDHGFANIHTVIRPNIWLKQFNPDEKSPKVYFRAAGGSAFLYIRDKKDSALVQEVKQILENVDEQQYFAVYDRKKLNVLGADSAAILALAAKPGYVFSGGTQRSITEQTSGGHHGYDPNFPEMYTGFIAAGRGINNGAIIKEMCVTDIAPLIAKLLGIEFKCPDGKLPEGLWEKKQPK